MSFLEALPDHYRARGTEVMVLFWNHAAWHTSRTTRARLKAYNQQAKQKGLTRIFVCHLPARSPWLMPLDAAFAWMKHQVLELRLFESPDKLRERIEQAF